MGTGPIAMEHSIVDHKFVMNRKTHFKKSECRHARKWSYIVHHTLTPASKLLARWFKLSDLFQKINDELQHKKEGTLKEFKVWKFKFLPASWGGARLFKIPVKSLRYELCRIIWKTVYVEIMVVSSGGGREHNKYILVFQAIADNLLYNIYSGQAQHVFCTSSRLNNRSLVTTWRERNIEKIKD